ncbi:MAG: radical SAM protein [Candidatus Heimdallarchaeota archaeon]|nr:radical SAM protein [Candidatus Heimdallarchaeota archaeon]
MKESFNYLYGPVPSRRLGRSLGVSPIPPKTCNYSCVYCQVGRTTHYTNIRQDFFPKEAILAEIKRALKKTEDAIDYLTFVGEGEPTLCKSLGYLIQSTKEFSAIPLAVITNGALLYESTLREELLPVDVVLPTLDTADPRKFKKINRPIKGLTLEKIIDGMRAFREIFQGKIWMEVILVKGLNDGLEDANQLKILLDTLNCDRIYVNVPIRPPAESWVKIPEKSRIIKICQILEAENIAYYESSEGFHLDKAKEIEEEILRTTTRHPLREDQIQTMLDLPPEECKQLLEKMVAEGKIRLVTYNDRNFWINAQTKIKTRTL